MSSSLPRPDPAEPRSRVQQLLRWVWLAVGVLVLVLLLSAVVFVAREAIGVRGGGVSVSDSAKHEARAAAAQPLRYGLPQPVRGGALRIVLIRRGSGYTYESRASARASSGEGPIVNVAFLEGNGARLLLDRPAYIRDVTFPGASATGRGDTGEPASDSLRWIVYEMALEDGDGNGKIDELDPRSLYVSTLDGRGLRRVLPPGFELRDWGSQPDGSLVITALQLGKDPMREHAIVMDAAGAVRPYAALDSVVEAAGVIVAKP